jgi:hypothetical protein
LVSFGVTIVGSAITAIIVTNTWFVKLDARLEHIQTEELAEHDDIKKLQASMTDVDKRLNEIVASAKAVSAEREAEIQRLHAASEAADAEMRAKIGVLDERSKFTVDRALGPALPEPRKPAGR